MRPEALCGLLAEPERLRSYAAVALGAGSVDEVAERTGLPARAVVAALRRLEQGGLVATSAEGALVADVAAFKDAVREYGPKPAAEEPLDADRQRATVLRTFIADGRITQLPAARGKRRILLEHLVACFTPGVRYGEKEVDAVLRAWHDDHVTLRRYLIDEGLMSRNHGVYWRTGGYVDLDDN